MTTPWRCLVVYQHLPHYRYGVFSELDRSLLWEFTFAAGEQSADGSIAVIPKGETKRFVGLRNHWIWRGLLWQSGLCRLASEGAFDAVIFLGNSAFLSTWVAAAISRLRKTPVLFWTIGWHRPDRSLVKRWVRNAFYGLADQLLLYGVDGLQIGIAMGYPARKITVIGNSYASKTGEDSYREDNSAALEASLPPHGGESVGAVVRMNHEKRLDMLIDAVMLLRSGGRDVGVILTGQGPALTELKERAVRLGVPLFTTGPVYSGQGLDLVYDRLAVTVLPERAGLTVTQSMIYGRPVVTVNDPYRQVPEFRAVVPGETGELYEPGDIAGLSEAIRRCLDDVAREPAGVSRRCRQEIADHWSASAHAQKILDALSTAVKAQGHVGG